MQQGLLYYIDFLNRTEPPLEPNADNNYGCDNENGDFVLNVGEAIAYWYEIIRKLGKGSFG